MFDRASNKTEAHADGTEVRVILTFCEIYNCTLQIDTSMYVFVLIVSFI